MCDAAVARIADTAAEAAVDAAWAQWSALVPIAAPGGARRVWTLVDPEALVLLSLAGREREPRLDDLLAAWARVGSSLLGVQRLGTLAAVYPWPVRDGIGDFARMAADAGDGRWKRYASGAARSEPGPRRKDAGPLRLTDGPALMLRLRAGLGVSAKADLLTVLLGLGGAPAELRMLALSTGYSDRAVRTAAEEMALARLIHDVPGPRAAYRADPEAWARLLSTEVPAWRHWGSVFAFLAAVIDWARRAEQEGWSPYVASSRARDLVEEHGKRLRHAAWPLPDPAATRGAAYLEVFADAVDAAARWTREHLYG